MKQEPYIVKIRAQRTRILGLLTPKEGPSAILWEKEEEKKSRQI
jgi:hypothetical protein